MKGAGGEEFALSPRPATEPEKEALVSTDILPQPEYPQCPCANCRGRVAEGLALKARANLARRAVADREPWGVLANHIVELVEMMRARGMA